MEKQYKKGLVFAQAQKVRKSKKGDLLVFVSESLVISINKNYALKILTSESNQSQQTEEAS